MILVVIVVVGAVGTGIWRVAVLFHRVKQVEEQVKEQDAKMETIRQKVTNHLEGHPNPQHQSQISAEVSGMPDFEEYQRWRKLKGERLND